MRLPLCLLIGLLMANNQSFAQTQEEPDTIEQFYSENYNLIDKDFDKDQIPLDGEVVDMIPYRKGEKFGFVDKKTGIICITPQYEQVHAVYKEGAIVKNDNGYGLINKKGKPIIPLQFRKLEKENNIYAGLLSIVDTNIKDEMHNTAILSMHFDSTGRFLFEELSHDFRLFFGDDTLCWFRYGTVYHIRSKRGSLIKSFSYKEGIHFLGICQNLLLFANPTPDGMATYSAQTPQGKTIFSLKLATGFDGVYQLSEHLYGYYSHDGDFFFCDESGQEKPYGVVSESIGFFRYDGSFYDQEHYAVKDFNSEKYGIINRKGDIELPFEHRSIYPLAKDIFLCDGAKIIHPTGRTCIPYSPDAMTVEFLSQSNQSFLPGNERYLFKSYKALTKKNSKGVMQTFFEREHYAFRYTDSNNQVKIELPEGTKFAAQFSDGMAAFTDSTGALGFIDTNGKIIIKPQFELTLAGSYPLPYIITPQFIHGYAYIKSYKGYIDKKGRKYFEGKRVQDHYHFSH